MRTCVVLLALVACTSDGTDADTDTDTDTDTDADDPLDLPLFDIADLTFEGAFRVSADRFGESEMNYAVGPIAYRASTRSVFLVGHSWDNAVVEFPVPALVDSPVVSELEMATTSTQAFVSVLERLERNPQALDRIGGMAIIDGQLLVNAYEYYDAPGDNTHTSLVLRDPSDLAGSAIDGPFGFTGAARAAGWISPVPDAWQPLLGGAWITGNSSGEPIIGRLSVGPSAFVFDPADVTGTVGETVQASEILGYSLDHRLADDLENASRANDLWTHLSRARFGWVVPGTRTYLTLGRSGGHASGVCYKCVPNGASEACGGYCANDVDDNDSYYWAFDLADLVAVRQGSRSPWEVQPYAYGALELPFGLEPGGGSFDPASGLVYVTILGADRDQGAYANPPVVVAFRAPPP